MCMCTCTCTHTHACTRTHTHTHTHTHTKYGKQTHITICICTCTHTHTHTKYGKQTHITICTCTCTRTHTHTHTQPATHTQTEKNDLYFLMSHNVNYTVWQSTNYPWSIQSAVKTIHQKITIKILFCTFAELTCIFSTGPAQAFGTNVSD